MDFVSAKLSIQIVIAFFSLILSLRRFEIIKFVDRNVSAFVEVVIERTLKSIVRSHVYVDNKRLLTIALKSLYARYQGS